MKISHSMKKSTGHGTGVVMPRVQGRRRRLSMGQERQRRFEDHRGRTISAKKRAAHLKDAPAGDLSGAFLAAMKSRGWLASGEAARRKKGHGPVRARLARGEISYLEACAVAPHASADTKRKWRKVARA
jgi:hypothetical protein